MSNFDFLSTRKTLRPAHLKRVTWLEHTVTQLKDYLKRCPECKKNQLVILIDKYSTLADNLQYKYELKGLS